MTCLLHEPRYRACLVLGDYQELICPEIGEMFGCSPSGASTLLFWARAKSRRIYQRLSGAESF